MTIMQYLSMDLGEKRDWRTNEARMVAFLEDGEAPHSLIQTQLFGTKPLILGSVPDT
ncbi:hypothetical protein [Providencia sp.]|uniref:hypothetical protein n=1 Tax=Providencia sp. TaxID=589 RepID=UPI00333E3883